MGRSQRRKLAPTRRHVSRPAGTPLVTFSGNSPWLISWLKRPGGELAGGGSAYPTIVLVGTSRSPSRPVDHQVIHQSVSKSTFPRPGASAPAARPALAARTGHENAYVNSNVRTPGLGILSAHTGAVHPSLDFRGRSRGVRPLAQPAVVWLHARAPCCSPRPGGPLHRPC